MITDKSRKNLRNSRSQKNKYILSNNKSNQKVCTQFSNLLYRIPQSGFTFLREYSKIKFQVFDNVFPLVTSKFISSNTRIFATMHVKYDTYSNFHGRKTIYT